MSEQEEGNLHFDGDSYVPSEDSERLTKLFYRVKELMLDGKWRTYKQIQEVCGGSESSIGARLRDLRKQEFGGYGWERRYLGNGLFEYRVFENEPKFDFDSIGQGIFNGLH